MSEEEILRKKLERLNENSHYGIMIDTEITKIVRSHIKRLEEATMHADCEFCLKRDICTKDVPKPCNYRYTEEEHIADQMSTNGILPDMYLPKTYQKKTYEKEDNKMEPTSVWKIENIDKIWITQDGDEILLLLKNRDDLTKIILTGDAIKNHNDNFITTLKADLDENEKEFRKQDQKIRELEEENKKLKEENLCVTSRINAFKNTNGKLQDEVLELKYQLKDIQATKEVVEQKSSTRSDILDQAKKCVCGHREQDYGTPESNFQLIADLWNGYLGEKTDNPVISVTPVDVSMMMALMKIARIRNGGGSGDSFVDLAGYAACGGEIWHGQKAKDQN